MGKQKNIIFFIVILGLRRVSQIIFSVLYSPNKKNYLGINLGKWTNIISSIGYEQQQLINFVTSKPTPINTGHLDDFNISCGYGKGKCRAFWGQDFISSLKWLTTIQYIGKDIDISQPSDITNRFYNLHSLNPNRRYPHLFAQYIGPTTRKDGQNKDIANITRENTIRIGEEGIRYSCDMNKVEKISHLTYTEFLKAIDTHDLEYRYPCNTDELAHALAFNYYHYLDNVEKASLYYMVASFHDETPKITLSMPAIIQGREGNNKVSAFLWYDRLQNTYKELQNNELPEDKRKQIEDNVNNSLQKMVSEFSLHILTQATKNAKDKKENESCIYSQNCLQKNGYITSIISKIESNCSIDKIACEILSIGKDSKRIKKNGDLIYPISKNMIYSWKEDVGLWWVQSK